jgi:GT2 family glycosyltransferase
VNELTLHCDSVRGWASPAGGDVELQGWVEGPAPIARVVLSGDYIRRTAALGAPEPAGSGQRRRWLALAPGDALRACAPDARGVTVVALDQKLCTAALRVDVSEAVGPKEPWSIERQRETIEAGQPLLVCTEPAFDGNAVVDRRIGITGWAWAPAGISEVSARFDDCPPVVGLHGFESPYLVRIFGDHEGLTRAGFSIPIDASADGDELRRLTVAATTNDGRRLEWGALVKVDPDLLYRSKLARPEPHRSIPCGCVTGPEFSVFPLAPDRDLANDLEAQTYPWWRSAATEPLGVEQALHEAAALTTGFALLIAAGAELRSLALSAFAAAAAAEPQAVALYADHDGRDAAGHRCAPWYKPAWSPELLLATDYLGPLLALRPEAARALLAAGGPIENLYEAGLRLAELNLRVGHVARVAATVRSSNGVATQAQARAAIERLAQRRQRSVVIDELDLSRRRVMWPAAGDPLVSIVIPTNGTDGMVTRCLHSIAARTSYPRIETVIVDTSADGFAVAASDRGKPSSTVRVEGPFNFSTACNAGAAVATGGVLVFLNDDTEIESPDWIERLLDHALQPGVGPVGALLLFANRTIQHGGVMLTLPEGGAHHLLYGMTNDHGGPFGSLELVRNCVAVTAACVAVAREPFERLGGFDERFSLEYGDVDLCLRAREAGMRVVFSPDVVLIHHESRSRGDTRSHDDLERLRSRWNPVYPLGDPFYPLALDRWGRFLLNSEQDGSQR